MRSRIRRTDETVDACEVATGIEEVDVHVLARDAQPAQLLRPAAEEPDAQPGILESLKDVATALWEEAMLLFGRLVDLVRDVPRLLTGPNGTH